MGIALAALITVAINAAINPPDPDYVAIKFSATANDYRVATCRRSSQKIECQLNITPR